MKEAFVTCMAILTAMGLAQGIEINDHPRADAGPSRYVASEPIRLDGTASVAPEGSGPLQFAWRQVDGPSVVLVEADSPTPTLSGFVQSDTVQRCRFELVVTDGEGRSDIDWVEVAIVPEFGPSTLALVNEAFDPNKPLFIFFTGGSTCARGGGLVIDDPAFLEFTNHIGFPSGYSPDPGSNPRAFNRYADMLIVYLSSVAPEYRQPIQTCGFSAGGMPALDMGVHMNQTYADPRYAINRVTMLDGGFCLGRYGRPLERIEAFAQNPVDGEACWIDNYMAANQSVFPNVLNVSLPLSHPGCVEWYFNSFVSADANRYNEGLVAGAYLSVLGAGRHLHLVSTPGERTYSFRWSGAMINGRMVLADTARPARIPQPVTLIGPPDGHAVDPGGVILSCEESMHAVGYQLVFGRDPYHMTYLVSDTNTPPESLATTFPFETTWWTVKAYDAYGSTIHADPRLLYTSHVQPQVIKNVTTDRTYASIQEAVNDAWDGHEIVLSPGPRHYLESINLKGKSLTLRSIDPLDPTVVSTTVIQSAFRRPAVTFSGDATVSCALDGLAIVGDSACVASPGMVSATISNCVLESSGSVTVEHWGRQPEFVDSIISGEVVDRALLAHWTLDETSGDTAFDHAGDYHGTLQGEAPATWLPDQGMVNGALRFDGLDDSVRMPFVLDPSKGPFSVFAWIRGGRAGQVILSQQDRVNWLLAEASAGALKTELKSKDRHARRELGSQIPITDGDWHRIGLTWDGLNRILYVDDEIAAADTQPDLRDAQTTMILGAGKNLNTGTFWSGVIDDVRIHDRAIQP